METTLVQTPSSSSALRTRVLVYFRLLRPANLVTSAADILTAAVILHLGGVRLAWLVGASVLLYAGGVVLNDFCDRQLDAIERPERPIPAGAISASAAGWLGLILLLGGIVAAFGASLFSGGIAVCLAAAILLYDAVAKPSPAGPLVMGACRALNLLLGLSADPALLPHTWFLTLLPFAYIVGITTLSRGEVHGGTRATSGFALFLCSSVLLALVLLSCLGTHRWASLLPFALLFTARVGPPLWRAYRMPQAGTIRTAVHAGILSLIVLDAALAASFSGVLLGAAILSLAVFTGELAKLFPVT